MTTTASSQLTEAERRSRHEPVETRVRELDHRAGDGIDVTLRWDRVTDAVSVVVRDARLGRSFMFGVDPGDALCAFHHPYAYAVSLETAVHELAPITEQTP